MLDEFENDLLTTELIDDRSASKERDSDEEDETASPTITMWRVCHLDALHTIRIFSLF